MHRSCGNFPKAHKQNELTVQLGGRSPAHPYPSLLAADVQDIKINITTQTF
jgi:hypothetical protein